MLAAVAVFALVLRLPGVTSGLPDFIDEALPLRHALQMWEGRDGGIDWNPHRFHYPTLTFCLHLLVQQLLFAFGLATGALSSRADFIIGFFADPTASVVAGRLIHALCDVASVIALGLAGERIARGAGLVAAALFACAPSTVLTARAVTTDTVMTAFALIALERMLGWHAAGGRGRLLAASVALGLAAGSKYPGFAMLAPLAWLAWSREAGPGRPARALSAWALAAGVAAVTFLVTTPYALLDGAAFLRDVAFVGRFTSAGHLGNFDRAGLGFHAHNLLRDLGPLGVLAAAAAPVVAWGRRGQAPALIAAGIALLVFGMPIAVARVEAERYVLPVVAFGALLAGASASALASWRPATRGRTLIAVGLAALVGPVLLGGLGAAWRTGSTQLVAREWVERSLPGDALIVRELYGPSVLPRAEHLRITSSAMFRAARRDVQDRYRARRWMPVLELPIATVGRLVNPVRRPDGQVERVTVLDQGADFNRVFYDPRLLAGADVVVTSSAVRGRFEASPERFPVQHRFYALLDSTAELAARFDPHSRVDGPNIRVYRLGPRARAAIAALGPLDPLWWTEAVPRGYRRLADSLLAQPGGGDSTLAPDGRAAPWVRSLEPIFLERLGPFLVVGTIEHLELRHWDLAGRFARAILEMSPADVGAALSLARAARERGEWEEALPFLDHAVSSLGSGAPPELRLELAEALWRTGRRARAEEQLAAVARGSRGAAAAAEAARRRLAGGAAAR